MSKVSKERFSKTVLLSHKWQYLPISLLTSLVFITEVRMPLNSMDNKLLKYMVGRNKGMVKNFGSSKIPSEKIGVRKVPPVYYLQTNQHNSIFGLLVSHLTHTQWQNTTQCKKSIKRETLLQQNNRKKKSLWKMLSISMDRLLKNEIIYYAA